MALTIFDPTREALSLREAVNRLFEDSFVRPETARHNPFPLDVLETNDALVIHASLPGFNKDGLEIHVDNDVLTIKAEHQLSETQEKERYLVRERVYGSFKRSIRLPFPVHSENAKADFENGVLTLTLPKQEAIKPRTIKVS